MNSTDRIIGNSSLVRALWATGSIVAFTAIGRSQVQTQSGYLADPTLSAPVVSQTVAEIAPSFYINSYTGSFTGPGSVTTFGAELDNTGTPTSTGFATAGASGALNASSGLLDPSVSAAINSTVNSTFRVDSNLTYSFYIMPVGGLTSGTTGLPVSVDITGSAAVTSTGAFYDSAYDSSETASLSIALGGASANIVNLSGLSATTFDYSGGLFTGSVYTLTLDASLYTGGESESLQAYLDPQVSVGSGYSVVFSPGFPGSGSASGPSVPDAASTSGLLALAMCGLVAMRKRLRP